jgi:hypothetical protein
VTAQIIATVREAAKTTLETCTGSRAIWPTIVACATRPFVLPQRSAQVFVAAMWTATASLNVQIGAIARAIVTPDLCVARSIRASQTPVVSTRVVQETSTATVSTMFAVRTATTMIIALQAKPV